MSKQQILVSKTGGQISKTGIDALSAFLDTRENIVIGASAGTGKTTLLTNIIAEYVIREAGRDQNPFDKIVATTFTVEAARQIKEKVRERLSSFHNNPDYGPLPNYEPLIYSLEAESWIFTIDALTLKLAKMMSLDLEISPGVEIIDEFTNNELIEKARNTIKKDHIQEYSFLETVFGIDLQDILTSALELISTYLITTKEFETKIEESFNSFYLNSIILGNNAKAIQQYNQQILVSLKIVLSTFVQEYRDLLDEKSMYTYSEIRRRVVEYLKSSKSKDWHSYLSDRIQLLLVDEFQDTSVAQVKLLSSIIGQTTSILLIGDAKQSIYTWRNAAPTIIMDIIDAAKKSPPRKDKHFKKAFKYFEVCENYRSVSDLVDLQNHFFSIQNSDSIFQKPLYTKAMKVPNPVVTCNTKTPSTILQPPHIHHYIVKDAGRVSVKMQEEEYIVAELKKILEGKSNLKVRKEAYNSTGQKIVKWEAPKLGDCAVLMPRRSKWQRLRRLLLDAEIPYVMIKDQGFYQRPEISLLIDFLDWLGDPFQNDALIRILRSPFIGASDVLIRTLIDLNFRFDKTEKEIEKQYNSTTNKSIKKIFERDLIALRRVTNLKNNLRWSREGKKSKLVEEILRTSYFREILMMYFEGEQCVANLNMLTDTINSWEEEEIISYRELIQRLKFYHSAPAANQTQAFLSDLENERAVKISTIHSTKGLEFPIVFIFTVTRTLNQEWNDRNVYRARGNYRIWYNNITGSFIHLRQLPPAGASNDTINNLSRIYSKAPDYFNQTNLTQFQKDIAQICRGNFAEKMRLYYVAVTRAKDHLYQGHRETNGSPSWGCEFLQHLSKLKKKIPNIKDEELTTRYAFLGQSGTGTGQPSLSFIPNKTLDKIHSEFIPIVLDPTHIYDLLLCPRRYQYTTLRGATGAKCHEIERGDFDYYFGDILHSSLERFDYKNYDQSESKSLVESLEWLHQYPNVKQDLIEAVDAFSTFIKNEFDSLIKRGAQIFIEKPVQGSIQNGTTPIELRGIIDLLFVDGNDVYLYDVKSNYRKDDQKHSPKQKAHNKFLREHHHYQLLTYTCLLAKMNYNVKEVAILSVFKDSANNIRWEKVPISSAIDIEKSITQKMPLKVTLEGLEKTKNPFCQFCEFCWMCWDKSISGKKKTKTGKAGKKYTKVKKQTSG